VDESLEQALRMLADQFPLPFGDLDHPFVFEPRSMLREQARPVAPVRVDLYALASGDSARTASSSGLHRLAGLADDARILGVKEDPQPVDVTRMPRDASIPEVQAQEVHILRW
jgi:hypothetical protein